MRDDPAVLEGGLDDQLFALADHHGLLVELADAAGLAKCGTDAGRELREVAVDAEEFVGALQVAGRDGAVLVRDEIAERTPRAMAEGKSAALAALDLRLEVFKGEELLDFLEVALALFHRTVIIVNAFHIRDSGFQLSIVGCRPHASLTGTTFTNLGR